MFVPLRPPFSLLQQLQDRFPPLIGTWEYHGLLNGYYNGNTSWIYLLVYIVYVYVYIYINMIKYVYNMYIPLY